MLKSKLKVIRLRVKGNFNSFRIRSGIRYHQTYHVPTKTTLIGLVGAAIGLDEFDLDRIYKRIQTNALLDRYSGRANDLWLITKIKTDNLNKPESSLVSREMLFEPEYTIYYSVDSKNDTENIEYDDIISAFDDPEFPLTLGRSDEMIEVVAKPKVIDLIPITINEKQYYRNTILPFNYKNHFEGYEKTQLKKGYTFNLPQVLSIPTAFNLEAGIRRPTSHLQITLVYDTAVMITNRNDGWLDNESGRCLYIY